MATREQGIKQRIVDLRNQISKDTLPNQIAEKVAKAITETFDSGSIALVGGVPLPLPHNLGYIPSVTIVSSAPVFITALTDTIVTVQCASSISARVYCH